MLIYKKGNLLEAKEDLICHQCNTIALFGGGLAAQIKRKYPGCEKAVQDFVERHSEDIIGRYYYYYIEGRNTIVNCFTQNEDFTTNTEAIERIFSHLLGMCSTNHLSIAIPYMYGCGIARGNWTEVREIFTNLSIKYQVDISVYYLEDMDE